MFCGKPIYQYYSALETDILQPRFISYISIRYIVSYIVHVAVVALSLNVTQMSQFLPQHSSSIHSTILISDKNLQLFTRIPTNIKHYNISLFKDNILSCYSHFVIAKILHVIGYLIIGTVLHLSLIHI